METQHTIRSAIVSTDADFRAVVRAALQDGVREPPRVLEIPASFQEIGAGELAELRRAAPDLVFLDLESDPALGVRFAHFLADSAPQRRIVAAGPPLGAETLLEAMRAGVSEYLPKPVSREALSAALERVLRKMAGGRADGPRLPGEILAVFSPKGGSGCTTVATNLAVHLHRLTGKRTLLVDLDLELGEAAVHLGVQPRFSFVDMIRNFHRMDAELLASYIERDDTGVHLLSAPFHPDAAEAVTADAIRRILQFLKEHYDHVVVDTPKSFAANTLAVFEQAERVLLVTTVDLPSLRNVKRCLPLLERAMGPGSDRLRLVVNRYDPADPIGLEEVARSVGTEVYWTLANDYGAVIGSINSGKPAVLNGKSPFTRDLMTLGADLAGLTPSKNGHGSRLGPLQRLFSRRKEATAHG